MKRNSAFISLALTDGSSGRPVPPPPAAHREAVATLPEPTRTPLPPESPAGARETRLIHLGSRSALLSQSPKDASAAEQYRVIRTKLGHRLKSPYRLVVASPGMGDGKTFTAVNLAIAMALKEESTLLIDADLRRSGIHRMLQAPLEPGLADVLAGRLGLEDAILAAENVPHLRILPAGKARSNPVELLDSPAWRRLAEEARAGFVNVVIDSPPIEVVADFDLIANACEGVLLVVRPNHTDRTACLKAIERVGTKLAGIVVNEAAEWFLWRKARSHGYAYYSGAPEAGGTAASKR